MADQLDPAMVAQISDQIRRSMGGALVQVGSDLQKLDRISKDVVSPSGGIGKLDSMFLGMSSRILGPVGLVAGLYQVSNALSKVAADSVQMQAFSRNTGIAADNVKNMQIQLQMMGKSSEEAKATVGQLAGLLNDFNTNRQGSSLSQNLLGREGGAAVIRDLNAAKNVTEQIAVILKTYQAQPTERQRRGVAEAFGMDPASIEQMVKDQNLIIYTYKANEKALEEFHRASVLFSHNIDEAWKAVTGNVIKALNDMTGGVDGGAKVFSTAVDGINAAVNSLFNGRASELGKLFNFGGLKQDMDDIRAFVNWWNSIEFKKNFQDATGIGKKYPMGGDPMSGTGSGNGPDRIGKTSGFTFGEPGTRAADEKEQTTLLAEIRDTLQGKVGTGSTYGIDYATGTRSGGSGGGEGGAMSASGGGFRPEGGIRGSRGDRNNNPGNLKMGPLAQSFGATHADNKGFAVFPDALSGSEAQRALVTSDKYKGLTLDQFGNKYSEGSESWKNTVGKSLGIGRGDIVDNNDPRLMGAIRKAEGTGNANSPGYVGGNGNGLPSAVIEEAKKVAANDGPGAVQSYIRSQGYNVNSAWCGDFAAAVVSASGGTPPKGASIASNWRKFGHQVDEPQPGDIAVRKSSRFGGYTPTGATGSHVTIFEGADGKGRFTGIGGNQSGRRSSFPMSGYEYFRGDAETQAARARMDAAKASGTENSLNAKVQFENVPPGVKTSVESEGEIFKELQVSKSKQGEVAGGSSGQPFSGVW